MTAAVSPHLQRIMNRYGVTTRAALLRAIRAEYAQETGARYTFRAADAILDQMAEAEYQRAVGGAYDRPREND